jgi:hypothetical protein
MAEIRIRDYPQRRWNDFKGDCYKRGMLVGDCLSALLDFAVSISEHRDILYRALENHTGTTLRPDWSHHDQLDLSEALQVLRKVLRP